MYLGTFKKRASQICHTHKDHNISHTKSHVNSFTGPFEFYDGKQGRLAFRSANYQGHGAGLSQDCLQANGPWNHQVKHQQNEVHMQPRGES